MSDYAWANYYRKNAQYFDDAGQEYNSWQTGWRLGQDDEKSGDAGVPRPPPGPPPREELPFLYPLSSPPPLDSGVGADHAQRGGLRTVPADRGLHTPKQPIDPDVQELIEHVASL